MSIFNQKGAIHFLIPLLLLAGIIGGVYLITSGNPLKMFSKATNPPIVFKGMNNQALPTNARGIPQTTSASIKIELTSTLGPPVFVTPSSSPTPTTNPAPTQVPTAGPPGNGTVSCNADNMASFSWTAGSFPGKTITNYTLRINKYPIEWAPDSSTPATAAVDGDRAIQTGAVTSIQVALTEGTYLNWSLQPGFSDGTVGEQYPGGNEFRCSPTYQTLGVTGSVAPSTNQVSGTVSYKIAENPTGLESAMPTAYTQDPMILDYTFVDSTPGQKFIWVEFRDVAGATDRRSAQIEVLAPPSPTISPTPVPSPSLTPTAQPRPSGNVKITVKREPRTPNRLTVEWSNLQGAVEKDWAGLFKKEDPADASHMREWLFLGSCSRTSAGKVPAQSGKCGMNMRSKLPVGNFELRLMTDNTYNVIARSNTIRVFTASP